MPGLILSKRAARQNYNQLAAKKCRWGSTRAGWVFHHELQSVSSVIAPDEGRVISAQEFAPTFRATTKVLKGGLQVPGNWSIGAKSTDRIDARRATRRKIRGEQRDRDHERAGCGQRDHVTRLHAEEIAANG